MNAANRSVFPQKLKEFYWTVTRAVGLGYLHDGSHDIANDLGLMNKAIRIASDLGLMNNAIRKALLRRQFIKTDRREDEAILAARLTEVL